MAIINHGDKLPFTEHTSNKTGRIVIYSIHQKGNMFLMLKDLVLNGGIIERDPKFLYATFDLEGLQKEMRRRAFVPMLPAPDDQKSLVCTFL